MDDDNEDDYFIQPERESSVSRGFRLFVCFSLTLLICSHLYTLAVNNSVTDNFDGTFSDIKYVVMQLSKSIADVNSKHERLTNELDRISAMLPRFANAAQKAREALTVSTKNANEKKIDVLDYDRQIIDFALESAGARILSTGDTIDHVHYDSMLTWALHTMTSWVCRECAGARAMLRPGSLPGECWAFKGHHGEASILLLGTVKITGVSLEHISPKIAPTKEISSAPRLFSIEGRDSSDPDVHHDFGTFEYNIKSKTIQHFQVLNPSSRGYNVIRIRFLSNWGNPVFTCVYRLRVHGDLMSGQAIHPAMEHDAI